MSEFTITHNNDQEPIPLSIDLDTFYITCLLLNYDISDKLRKQIYSTNSTNSNNCNLEKIEASNIEIIDNLLNIIITNKKFPLDILISKFFEFAVFKNIEPEYLFVLINQNSNFKSDEKNIVINDEIDDEFCKYFELVKQRNCIFKIFNHEHVYKKINQLFGTGLIKFIKSSPSDDPKLFLHKGIPLPDKNRGRPKLDWCVCQHEGCAEKFNSPSGLVNHLMKFGVYTKGYHSSHEHGVSYNNFTPTKVINQNITKCPSWMCKDKCFSTPQELIEHLEILGIKPFWKIGMDFSSKNLNNTKSNIKSSLYSFSYKHIQKIFTLETCPICLENPVEIIINKCGHQVYCAECLTKSSKSNCPICRGKVDAFIPYA